MRERLKQLTTVAALVLVAGGSLVGCSADDGETAGSTLTKANFFDEIRKGLVDAGSSHVKLSVDAAGQAIKAEGDYSIGKTPAETAMALTMDAGPAGLGTAEMRLVDETVYFNLGPMTSNKFTSLDLSDESNPIGQQFSSMVGSIDPTRHFEEFESAVKSFEQKGEANKLDGVEALPYVIIVDTSKLRSAPKRAGQSTPETVEYTIYVGPDNLPRRILSQIPGVGGSATIDYSQWGEDVAITKPKASEISDKDFLGQLGGDTPKAP